MWVVTFSCKLSTADIYLVGTLLPNENFRFIWISNLNENVTHNFPFVWKFYSKLKSKIMFHIVWIYFGIETKLYL